MRSIPRIKKLMRSGGVVPLVLGAVALSAAVLVSFSSYRSWSNANLNRRVSSVSRLMVEPTAMQMEVALRRAGLTPERLAAAGLVDQDVTGLVAAGRAYLNDHQVELEAADNAAGIARAEGDRLQRLVEGGLATENDVTALGVAQTDLNNANSNRDMILSTLYTAAVAGLGTERKTALATMKTNGTWDLPTQYLAVSHTEAQWVGLRDDLANLRIAFQLGEDPDPTCQQDVATANADPAVSAATTNLANNLAIVNQAWTEAIGG